MVPAALWLARLPSPDAPSAAHVDVDGRSILRRYAWLVGLIAAFFFMHMGAELAFGGWIYSYADAATGSATTARMVNAAFWGGIVLGRLAGVPLALRLSPRTMLLIDLLGATLSLSLLILLPDSQPALWFGTIAFGVAVATMIPSSFNLAERRMPISSQVSSTFLIGGSLGTMTLPWIVGQLWVPVGPPSGHVRDGCGHPGGVAPARAESSGRGGRGPWASRRPPGLGSHDPHARASRAPRFRRW